MNQRELNYSERNMVMDLCTLNNTARQMVAKGKGILAADESSGTIKKRFQSINVESTEENRQAYRELLFTAPDAEKYISGIILFDETIRQSTRSGVPFPTLLAQRGILTGIKVDKGAKALAGFPNETVTEGLDGLKDRLVEYKSMGASFTKWRAVIKIGPDIPSRFCIDANAHALARYAALSQQVGLVPIVEPEVLMDGSHDITRCHEVTAQALRRVFDALLEHRVALEGMLLKPNMVLSGKDHPNQAHIGEVAENTIRCFKHNVPAAVPGIVFLSGGQSSELATKHLNAMNHLDVSLPWELSFSFGRALQEDALNAWRGNPENAKAAQDAFINRASANSDARFGQYQFKTNPAA
jgi:fructose-bisphosphate aldolase class I